MLVNEVYKFIYQFCQMSIDKNMVVFTSDL